MCVRARVRACLGDEDDADEGEGGGDQRGRGEEVAGVVEDGQVLRLYYVVMHIMISYNLDRTWPGAPPILNYGDIAVRESIIWVKDGQVLHLGYILMHSTLHCTYITKESN